MGVFFLSLALVGAGFVILFLWIKFQLEVKRSVRLLEGGMALSVQLKRLGEVAMIELRYKFLNEKGFTSHSYQRWQDNVHRLRGLHCVQVYVIDARDIDEHVLNAIAACLKNQFSQSDNPFGFFEEAFWIEVLEANAVSAQKRELLRDAIAHEVLLQTGVTFRPNIGVDETQDLAMKAMRCDRFSGQGTTNR